MAQKFIDGTPFSIYGFIKRRWPQRDERVVELNIANKADVTLSSKGARRLANMLWDEATKADKAKA